jgi:hypothetical protein
MKIAIIGNSRALLNSKHGADIDSSDLTIRFNNFKLRNHKDFCGTKIDHVSLMVSSLESTLFETVTPYLLKDAKKILFPFRMSGDVERLEATKNKCLDYFFLSEETEFEAIDDKLIEDLTDRLRYYSERNGVKRENYNPSSGMTLIDHTLKNYPGSEITLYGFDPFKFEEHYANYWEPGLVLDNGVSHPLVAEGILIEKYRRAKLIDLK